MPTEQFEVRYAPTFLADWKRLESVTGQRILRAIEHKLTLDPWRHGRKLIGVTAAGRWRFRVGDYRVRYDIEGHTLVMIRVRHRREVYE